jgi:hypothetical protein
MRSSRAPQPARPRRSRHAPGAPYAGVAPGFLAGTRS